MTDYANLLLDAINGYNEEDKSSKEKLRNLVCLISEDKELKSSPLIKELLYTASQKMRVFGYNVQNEYYKNNDDLQINKSDLLYIRDQCILERYRSKVRSNNILDKTQKDIIEFYFSLEKRRMLVSAPTSYGKTFIMREIVFLNHQKYNNVLLVFPTVALLRENALNMEEMNREKELGYNVIKSIDGEINKEARNIFVFTPERALQLLVNYPDLKIDFFFYDEMYKIDEDYCHEDTDYNINDNVSSFFESNKTFLDEGRAKTFRICLYLLSKKVPDYYLAGPNIKEEKFGPGMRQYIRENNIKVKEIEFEPTIRIRVNAYDKVIEEDYGNLLFAQKPNSKILGKRVADRLNDIITYINENSYGATMLYCASPAKTNEYAIKLTQINGGNIVVDPKFLMFIDHLKRVYDINGSIKEWSFINVLEKGYGLHHGKMPKYIQKEVLDLFNDGILNLLFCTSTIVEGVNTNARNMVVLNSKKGGKEKLSIFDFKNIIGRAGRYYHNFVGRYFLADENLEKYVNMEDVELDFVTYSNIDLDVIDIDNADISDLSVTNKIAKEKRIHETKEFMLTEKVFLKNRLIKRENQEMLLRYLWKTDEMFKKFYDILKFNNILLSFAKYGAMRIVLETFNLAKLLDDNLTKVYTAIDFRYRTSGFKGLLRYEIDKTEEGVYNSRTKKRIYKSIDAAYMDAFKTQRDVIEFKFPKLLTLYEAIFMDVALRKNVNVDNFSLSKVIRYYETGVKSYFGEQLVEFGFPIDAIIELENNNPALISMNAEHTRQYIQKTHIWNAQYLDPYEKELMKRALKSIF